MPRVIEERWIGVGYDIVTEHLQVAGADGQPLFDGKGLPKTMPHTTLVFIHNEPGVQVVVRIPFTEEAKQELVKKLTGGILIPANGGGG